MHGEGRVCNDRDARAGLAGWPARRQNSLIVARRPALMAGWERGQNDQGELIEAMASKIDLPKATAERAVNLIFDDIIVALKSNDKVNISGFGTFTVSERKARQGRNPKTGETIEIPASRSAKFKPGKIAQGLPELGHAPPAPRAQVVSEPRAARARPLCR